MGYWHKDSHIDHEVVWSPAIGSHIDSQLILYQCAKVIQWCWNTDIHMDKNKTETLPHHTHTQKLSENGS